MGKTTIVHGGPGTGKTTRIIEEIKSRLMEPDGRNFSYVTFTNASARDFKRRISEEFGLNENDIKNLWVGTQHSMCLRLLGRSDIVTVQDRKEFCTTLHIDYDLPKSRQEDEMMGGEINENAPIGNNAFELDKKARAQRRQLTNDEILDCFAGRFGAKDMEMFSREWKAWKERTQRLDYEDMLEKVLERKLMLPVKRLYFDEFQDYGPLQYEVYKVWRDADVVSSVMIVGDADQAIFSFIGASPRFMLEEIGEHVVLEKNYRNPKKIYQYAHDLIMKNKVRKEMNVECVSEVEGIIEKVDLYCKPPDRLISMILPNETTLVLARTNKQCISLCEAFDNGLFPYQWLRVGTPWSIGFLALLDAIRKINTSWDEKLEPIELHSLINLLPQKDYIIRGKKTLLMKTFTPLSFRELQDTYLKHPEPVSLKSFAEGRGVRIATITEAVISHLESDRQHRIADIFIERGSPKIERKMEVEIGTFHSSKGLGRDTVILIDSLPKKVSNVILDNTDALEAERRVYYVAITRCKKRVVLVYNLFDKCDSFLH